MKCPRCGYQNVQGRSTCSLCHTPLQGQLPRTTTPPHVQHPISPSSPIHHAAPGQPKHQTSPLTSSVTPVSAAATGHTAPAQSVPPTRSTQQANPIQITRQPTPGRIPRQPTPGRVPRQPTPVSTAGGTSPYTKAANPTAARDLAQTALRSLGDLQDILGSSKTPPPSSQVTPQAQAPRQQSGRPAKSSTRQPSPFQMLPPNADQAEAGRPQTGVYRSDSGSYYTQSGTAYPSPAATEPAKTNQATQYPPATYGSGAYSSAPLPYTTSQPAPSFEASLEFERSDTMRMHPGTSPQTDAQHQSGSFASSTNASPYALPPKSESAQQAYIQTDKSDEDFERADTIRGPALPPQNKEEAIERSPSFERSDTIRGTQPVPEVQARPSVQLAEQEMDQEPELRVRHIETNRNVDIVSRSSDALAAINYNPDIATHPERPADTQEASSSPQRRAEIPVATSSDRLTGITRDASASAKPKPRQSMLPASANVPTTSSRPSYGERDKELPRLELGESQEANNREEAPKLGTAVDRSMSFISSPSSSEVLTQQSASSGDLTPVSSSIEPSSSSRTAPTAPSPNQRRPLPRPRLRPDFAFADQLELPAFWRRFTAGLVDFVLLFGVALLLVRLFGPTSKESFPHGLHGLDLLATLISRYTGQFFLLLGLFCGLNVAYQTVMNVLKGGTLGKLLLGLRVVDQSGKTLGWFSSFTRAFSYVFFFCCALVGPAWVLIDRQYRGLHDKIVGSLVVRSRPESA